LQG
jgi:hypothetical protein